MAGKRHCPKTKRHEQQLETSLLDAFSPVKLKKILPTSAKKTEDVLNSFRPNQGECLSYDISQTVLKMEAGDVKINLKDISATYVPAPPVTPKKKKKVSAPPYKFINEIWLEKQTALEEQYKKENRRYFKLKKKQNRIRAEKIHHFVLSMGGPDWFQELSPNQLRTVNQLECCILKDVKANTITNVQENIANLGLLLRPNHRHIEKALRLCRKNPVEFLLILYQIMNPKRKVYSLNDRLLLSAVTHLCMTQTLRELHVRIPSPPVRKRIRRIKPKVEKKIKYPSPYLEPLFFTPVLPEYTGVYENPHIQYPESPYFSYLQTMHIERFMTADVLELDLAKFKAGEVELYEDMKRAQVLYNEIRKGKRVKLLKPTVMEKYEMPVKKKRISLKLPPLLTFDDPEEKCTCGEINEQDNDSCCDYEPVICECEEKCDCKKKSRTFTSPKCEWCLAREREKHIQRIIKCITITRDNEAVSVIEGTLPEENCDCLQKYKDNIMAVKARNLLQCQKVKYIIGGVAMTKGGPVYILSTALKKVKKKIFIDPNLSEQTEEKDEAILGERIESAFNKTYRETAEENAGESESHEIRTNTKDDINESDSSSCRSDASECKYLKKANMYGQTKCLKCEMKIQQQYVDCLVQGVRHTEFKGVRLFEDNPSCDLLEGCAKDKTQTQESELVIGEATSTDEGPADISCSSLLDRKVGAHCRSRSRGRQEKSVTVEEEKDKTKEEEEEEDMKYSGCKCRQEVERLLNHECTCKECQERIKKEVIHIIGGTRCINDQNAVNILQGIHEQRCDCLAKYREKIDRLDDYRKRIEARYNLKSQTLKFSIGGVVSGPNGPVYVITGMRRPVECECAKAARRKEEEEQQSRQMARMPPTGRIKYQITGVRNTPTGNVFIISQALAVDDCECVKLYDTFSQAHRACLDIYESYLKQTNEALEEYVYQEVENNSREEPDVSEFTELTEQAWKEVIDIHELHSNNSFSNYNLFEQGKVVRGISPICSGQKLDICNRGEVVSLSGESVISQCESCDEDNEEETLSDSSEESQQCANSCLQDSKSGSLPVEEEKPVQVEVKQKLKRFVILKKIPSDYKKQKRILKKVLATMADDNFPLAKLPDCHKLPHFKLWMSMRCGKFWTQKEINSLVPFSKTYWYHTGVCPIHYTLPSLGITRKQANEMTWNQAQYIKKIVAEKNDAFYREINQNTVENAREFFPMTFSYEFPNKTFRDVFFSYLPGKEKDTLSYHLMKPHDMRVISKRYSCYC